MTDPAPQVTAAEVDGQVLSLARLLTAHPSALRTLEASIERRQAAQAQTTRSAPTLDCPHCGAPGIVYLTLPTKTGVREFSRRPMDCCQPALRDAAERALHYALNPHSVPEERFENADRYAALKESITEPELLNELATHEEILFGIHKRVTGLHRAQGGVD